MTTMMGINIMQTSQYGKSAFVKVFHTRVTLVKLHNTTEQTTIPLLKLRSKSSFSYGIQGIRADCLVSGQVWTLFRITSLLQTSVKLFFKELKGKTHFLTNFSGKNMTAAQVNGRSATEFTETNIAHQGLQISYNPAGSVLITQGKSRN